VLRPETVRDLQQADRCRDARRNREKGLNATAKRIVDSLASPFGAFLEPKLLRPSFLDGRREARTWLEQDLERESRGAADREQMTRLPEVCV
jgi:hypothetical protein